MGEEEKEVVSLGRRVRDFVNRAWTPVCGDLGHRVRLGHACIILQLCTPYQQDLFPCRPLPQTSSRHGTKLSADTWVTLYSLRSFYNMATLRSTHD